MLIGIPFLTFLVFVTCQDNNNIYWGSYDLTIPGGSGAGNAVQHLSLPDNAPDFFKFATFNREPLQAQPVNQPAPRTNQFIPAAQNNQFRPAPQPAQRFKPVPQPAQQFRPAPQPATQFRPAPQPATQFRPAPQPATQFRPAPQKEPIQVQSQFSLQTIIGSTQQQGAIPASTQQFRVFEPQTKIPEQRESFPAQIESSAATQRFQNFATRPEPRPAVAPRFQTAPRQQPQPAPLDTTAPVSARQYAHDSSGDNQLSRFQLYQLRKKGGQQQQVFQPQVVQQAVQNEVQTREVISRKKVAVRRKKFRNTA